MKISGGITGFQQNSDSQKYLQKLDDSEKVNDLLQKEK